MIPFLVFALAADPAPSLPKEWHGTWTGTMTVNALEADSPKVPVTLEIEPELAVSTYTWKTSFAGERPMVKDYRMILKAGGAFVLDEKNGIELGGRIAGKVMTSTFETGGFLLVSRYELDGKKLKSEIVTHGKPTEKTGVKSYPVIGVQTVEFTRP